MYIHKKSCDGWCIFSMITPQRSGKENKEVGILSRNLRFLGAIFVMVFGALFGALPARAVYIEYEDCTNGSVCTETALDQNVALTFPLPNGNWASPGWAVFSKEIKPASVCFDNGDYGGAIELYTSQIGTVWVYLQCNESTGYYDTVFSHTQADGNQNSELSSGWGYLSVGPGYYATRGNIFLIDPYVGKWLDYYGDVETCDGMCGDGVIVVRDVQKCPAGYYCPGAGPFVQLLYNDENIYGRIKCPDGTYSEPGATSVNDCVPYEQADDGAKQYLATCEYTYDNMDAKISCREGLVRDCWCKLAEDDTSQAVLNDCSADVQEDGNGNRYCVVNYVDIADSTYRAYCRPSTREEDGRSEDDTLNSEIIYCEARLSSKSGATKYYVKYDLNGGIWQNSDTTGVTNYIDDGSGSCSDEDRVYLGEPYRADCTFDYWIDANRDDDEPFNGTTDPEKNQYFCPGDFQGVSVRAKWSCEPGLTKAVRECAAGEYLPAGQDDCVVCPPDGSGVYCPGGVFGAIGDGGYTEDQGRFECAIGSYEDDGNLGDTGGVKQCTACDGGYTTPKAGAPNHYSCDTCDNNTSGVSSWATPVWNSNNYVNNLCQISSCHTGYKSVTGDGVDGRCSIITYSITYNLNGGKNPSGTRTSYNVKSSTYTLPTPTKSGYTFGGWYTNSGLTGNAVTTIAAGSIGNKTFYAKWTANGITCAAGKYLPANSTTCTTCPAGSYCPGGTWSQSSSAQGLNTCPSFGDVNSNFDSLVAGDNSCMVDGGFAPDVTGITSKSGCVYDATCGTKASWVERRGFSSASATSYDKLIGTYYFDVPAGYGYYMSGPTTKCLNTLGSGPKTSGVGYSTLTKCETGYYCPGGNSYANSAVTCGGTNNPQIIGRTQCPTGYTSAAGATSASACTAATYKVTLDKQSGTGGTSEYYYQYNTKGTCYYYTTSALSTCTDSSDGQNITKPTRTGYDFKGYYTGTDGTGTQYVNASGLAINNLYKTAGNRTLYANWSPKTWYVYFYDDVAAGACSGFVGVYSLEYGNTASGINQPDGCEWYDDDGYSVMPKGDAPNGYRFAGWYTGENGTGIQLTDENGRILDNVFTTDFGDDGAEIAAYAKFVPNVTPTFTVTVKTTEANTAFSFKLAATGTFYVDWGDGSAMETITRTNTTQTTYSHTFATAGTYTVGFAGRATGYVTQPTLSDSACTSNAGTSACGNSIPAFTLQGMGKYIYGMSGSIGSIFPTLASGAQPGFRFAFSSIQATSIPENLFSGITGTPTACMFNDTFYGAKITSIPENLFHGITGTAPGLFSGTFWGTKITSIPAGLFSTITGTLQPYMFEATFIDTTAVTSVPAGLFGGVTGAPARCAFKDTFRSAEGVTALPANLFPNLSGKPGYYSLKNMFALASNLAGYVPQTMFSNLDSTGYSAGPMDSIFVDTKLETTCPAGKYQYLTGFEDDWESGIVCSDCAQTPYTDSGTDTETITNGSRSRTKTRSCYKTSVAGNKGGIAACDASTSCGAYTYGDWTYTCNTGYHLSGTTCVANTYTIKYQSGVNGATVLGTMPDTTCTYDQDCKLAPNGFSIHEKWKFIGWSRQILADAEYANGATVRNLTSRNGGTVYLYGIWEDCPACNATNANCTLTAPLGVCTYTTSCKTGYGNIQNNGAYNASCSASTYTITLRDYADANTHSTIYQVYGSKYYSDTSTETAITKATVPTRSGYKFRGFYTVKQSDLTGNGGSGTRRITSDGTLPGNTTFTASTKLYAAWAQDCTTPSNGTCSLTINTDGTATYTASCNSGYTVSGATTATPSCTANTYTVTYAANGGTGSNQTQSVTYKSSFTTKASSTFTRSGYTFAGWGGNYPKSNTAYTYTTTGNTTLNAQWCQNCASVSNGSCTLTVNEATGACTYTTSCNAGYTISNNGKYNPTCTANTYTVSFNANGGSGGQSTSVTATYGAAMPAISTTAPTRTGYTFGGWYDTSAATGGTQYYTAAGASARSWNKTANTTLYARWTVKSIKCAAGKYLPAGKDACATCVAGYACAGGTWTYDGDEHGRTQCTGATYAGAGATQCTSCPSPYTYDVSAGKTKIEQCTVQTTAGSYIKDAKGDKVSCPTGYYCPSAVVAYGSTNSPTACPAIASHTPTTWQSNYYNPTPVSSEFTSAGGESIDRCAVTYTLKNDRGTISTLKMYNPETDKYDYGWQNDYYMLYISLNPGYYFTKKWSVTLSDGEHTMCDESADNPKIYVDAAPCPAGSYCPGYVDSLDMNGGTHPDSWPKCSDGEYTDTMGIYACPTTYPNSAAKSSAIEQCWLTTTAGKYVATARADQVQCLANNYCAGGTTVNYGSTGGMQSCATGYESAAGASSCTATTYSITYNLNGGTNAAGAKTSYTIETADYTLPTPTKTGYTFGGWYENSGLTGSAVTKIAKGSTGNKTYWAKWTIKSVNCAAGKYLPANSLTCGDCTAGYACAGGTYSYSSSTQGRSACTGRTKYSAAGAASCNTVSSGYYTTGCNSSNNNCTGQTQCTGTTYCSGGVKSDCPSGYTANTTAGKTAASQCTISVPAGKYLGTANGTTTTSCAAGTYKAAHTVNYGSTSSCGACTGRTKYSASGAASCSTVSSGYYTTGCNTSGNNCTGQSQCDGGVYCTGGIQNDCPTAETGWTQGTGKGWSAVTSCFETKAATSVSTYCSAGQLKKNATSSTAWGTSTISTALQAKAGSFVSGQTCTQCTGASYSAGGTATSCTSCPSGYAANTDNGKTAATQCEISIAAGKYLGTAKGATTTSCAAGTYKAAHNVSYGSTSSCSACSGRTKYSAAGAASCSNVGSGYYTTGCDTSGNKCTGQKQCTSGTWCAAGVMNQCSSLAGVSSAGGVYSSAVGSTANTACKYTAPTQIITGCLSVISNTVTYTGSAWPKTTYEADAAAGYIVANNNTAGATCTQCTGATYSAGGRATSCTACPTGYTANTDNGKSAASQCTISVTGGHYIGTAGQNSTNWGTCAAGSYKAAHTVNYGSTSSCSACTGRTKYSASGAASCSTVSTGYYTTGCNTSNNNCTGQKQCTSGTWCASGVMNQCSSLSGVSVSGGTYSSAAGSTANTACKYTGPSKTLSGCKTVTTNTVTYTGTAWPATTYSVTANGGYIISNNNQAAAACTQCSGAVYSAGGTATSCAACPSAESGWTQGTGKGWSAVTSCFETKAATSASTYCSAGQLKKNATSATAWGNSTISTALQAKPGSIVSGQTCTQCSGAKYSAGGTATSCASCPAATSGWTLGTGTGWSAVTSCYQTKAATSVSTYCAAGQLKQNATSATAWGNSTISTALTAKPGAIVSGQTCTQCTGTSYSAGGTATLCELCPDGYTNDIGNGKTSASQCAISVDGGHYIGTAGQDSTNWGTCAAGTYKDIHLVYYGSTSSCSACTGRTKYSASGASACSTVSNGYYTTGCNTSNNNCTGQSQCTSGTWCASGVMNQCSSLTGVSVSGGTYSSAAGSTANTACKYTGPSKTLSGCKTVTTNTVTYTGTAWPATTYSVTANGGYIISNNNQAAAACTQCGTGKYSAGGTATSCSSCPTADSGWTATAPAGSTSYSACYEYQTPANCASGSVKRTATSATAYGTTIALLNKLSSKAGYYASATATSCTICPTGSSCAAGATAPMVCANWTYAPKTGMSSCTACPALTTGWSKFDSSSDGWKSHTMCIQVSPTPDSCSAGNLKQVASADGATTWGTSSVNTALKATAGNYVAGTSCTSCRGLGGGFYPNSDADNAGGASACYTNSISGGYVASATDHQATDCAAGTYKGAHTVHFGSTSSCDSCMGRTKYSAAGASACSTVSTGYYTTGCDTSSNKCTGQSQCDGSVYCTGGVQKNCPAAESKWTLGTGKGWSAITSCFETIQVADEVQYCSAGQLKKNATTDGAWPTVATTSVAIQAKPGSVVVGQSCAQCSGASYSAGGTATQCSSCPTATSGWTRNTGTGWSKVEQCNQTKTVGGNCAAGQLKQNATSATAWGASTISIALSAKPGAFVNGQTCSQCNGALYSAGGTVTSCSSCPTATSGWTISSGIGWTKVEQCNQTKTVGGYCSAGALIQNATSSTTWGTSEILTELQAKPGSIVSGQTCTQCSGAKYSAGGTATSCASCPAATSGWTLGTGTGWSAVTSCYQTKAATSVSAYCAAGQLKQNATSATAWGTSTISTALTAKAGAIVDGQTCTQCSGATYSGGGVVTQCSVCPTGYDANIVNGKTAASQCQIKCSAKTVVSIVNGSCTALTTGGYYKGEHLVNYGSTSSAEQCPAGYRDGAVGAAITDCAKSVAGGNYVRTAKDENASTCVAGTYRTAHTVTYGNTSSCSACNGRTKYSAAGAASCSNVSTGYYTTGCNTNNNNCTGQSQCDGSVYCTGGILNNCPTAETGWTQGTGKGWSVVTSCFETKAATSVSTYCASGVLKKNATSGTAWGTSTISTALTAKAGAIVDGQTCTQCSGASYSAGGTATLCELCPAGYEANIGNGKTAATQCEISVDGGHYIGAAGQNSTNWGTCVAGTFKANHFVRYGNTSSCDACTSRTKYSAAGASACSTVSGGYYTTGCTGEDKCTGQAQCTSGTWCASGVMNQCSSLSGVSVSGGSYSSATGSTANTACKYTGPLQIIDGCSYVTPNTVTYTGTTWPESTYMVDAMPGWYVVGDNTADATCKQCSGAVYSAGGKATSCASCPSATSGWTRNTGTGWSKVEQCNQTKTVGGYCSAGELKQNATSATAWGTSTISVPLQAKAGSIVSGQTCAQCSGAKYSAGGTVTSCTACPTADTGWTLGTGTGWTSYSACYEYQTPTNCASGSVKRVASDASAYSATITLRNTLSSKAGYYASTTATSCTICPKGSSCAAGAVNPTACANWTFADKTGMSSCTSCPSVTSGWSKSNTTGTGWTSYSQCQQTTGTPEHCVSGGLKQTATSSTTWGASTVNVALSADAGYYVNGTACSICTGATYSGGGTLTKCDECPTIYTHNTTDGKIHIDQCQAKTTAGKYIKTENDDMETVCAAGGYCAGGTIVNWGGTGGRTLCTAGTYNPNTGSSLATACVKSDAGYYVGTNGATAQTACTGATYTDVTGATKCTTCPTATKYADALARYSYYNTGTIGDHTTKSKCQAVFNSTIDHGTLVNDACYLGSDDDYGTSTSNGASTCWLLKDGLSCDGGYYNKSQYAATRATVLSNACIAVGAGYWSSTGELTRSQCGSGLTTIGYGAGADEAGDCGRILHAGEHTIYLRSTKKTTPSLNVDINGTVFYGNMTQGTSRGKFRVNNGGTVYSVHNDATESIERQIVQGQVSMSGPFTSTNKRLRTDYIPVEPNTQYTVTYTSTATPNLIYATYDANKSMLSRANSKRTGFTFTTEANAKYVAFTWYGNDSATVTPSDVQNFRLEQW